MSSREQLVDQLRKMQTLAQRAAGTPEGAAARRKLRELMKRHGFSIRDLRPAPPPAAPVRHEVTETTSTTPAIITLKVGNFRIRWKL